MDKVFAEIFSKHPDEIIDGDYFYYSPWFETQDVTFAAMKGITVEELREKKKKNWLGLDFAKGSGSSFTSGSFNTFWNERTFQSEFVKNSNEPDPFEDWIISVQTEIENGFTKINEILGKIAAENKPFIDISSSDSWGFIPFIAKLNPQIPCMATDIYAHLIKCQRIFLNSNLTQYNINLACFDNNNIPIKSNALDYITSTFGIISSASNDAARNFFNIVVGKEKTINEVYRILKPDGRFVTIENNREWKFDLTKTREACNRRGKLFGTYTYNEIAEIAEEWNKVKELSLRGQFVESGFQVDVEEKYPLTKGCRLEIKPLFQVLTDRLKIHEWTDDERKEYKEHSLYRNRKDFEKEAEDFGIELTQDDVFYALRKPD